METLAPGMRGHARLTLCTRGACLWMNGSVNAANNTREFAPSNRSLETNPVSVLDFKMYKLKCLHDVVQQLTAKNMEWNGWSDGFIPSVEFIDIYETGVVGKCPSSNTRQHLQVHPVQREVPVVRSGSTQQRSSSCCGSGTPSASSRSTC